MYSIAGIAFRDFAIETIGDSGGIAQRYVDCRKLEKMLNLPGEPLGFAKAHKMWLICFLNRWHDRWFGA